MPEIHPTAIVAPGAELGQGVRVGPYSIIGDHVTIGPDTEIVAHVYIEGHTQIGERNTISPFSCIGMPPQDIGYRGEDTRVVIGNDNIIRENVTIHRATTKEDRQTVVGNNNFIMAYSHIAHDCALGNGVIMANVATLAGHTKVGDHATIGGLVAIHQFVRIGAYAFIGGQTGIAQDVPPFMMASGARASLYGINQKGLTRKGFDRRTIDGLKKAYRIIWREHTKLQEGIRQVREEIESFPELETLLDFLENSKRGILR
ncbi:UDP-N-acetylglucosamine acetyltransferase [uncultured Desulfobacterium sp.]|uniref:Acyl-[acyl-carrier-protein]--UDP-N-acetylglucosamine O-acyltransferase n=1 Tax=uncultured Desulfobacterium sp. TaxID=201089 RepID=A0A445N043_9BACT|nr:UDP-N-acetylglucosamine acetyltransferase [uncultured Desulfobacterium sp.]